MTQKIFAQKLALRMLAGEGLPEIWQLHVAASDAHRRGRSEVAVILTDIADAAEREWRLGVSGAKVRFGIGASYTTPEGTIEDGDSCCRGCPNQPCRGGPRPLPVIGSQNKPSRYNQDGSKCTRNHRRVNGCRIC